MNKQIDEEEFFLNLRGKTDDEIKAVLEGLYKEERRISYRRRILHGRIDILKAELISRLRDNFKKNKFKEIDIDSLVKILSKPSPFVPDLDFLDE
jgi:hypothetical protein